MAYIEKFVRSDASGGDGDDNLGLALSSATYDHADNGEGERHLSSAGAFSGYSFVAGDLIFLTGAPAGGIVDDTLYEIASRVDDDAILLVANAGLTADSTADVDSSAGPWTYAESLTNVGAGDRANVQSDAGYSIGVDSYTNAGTIAQLACWRGYNLLIGDLEASGWNTDGTLNVTNYPVITVTGIQTPAFHVLLQNLVFESTLASEIILSSTVDWFSMIEVKMTNTANDGFARCFRLDNECVFLNCDFECTGAAHNNVISADLNTWIIGCRVKGVESGQIFARIFTGNVLNTTFIGGSGTAGIGLEIFPGNGGQKIIIGCTFHNLETAIQFPNQPGNGPSVFVNNHVTNCTAYLDFLRQPTADTAIMEAYNRTRDNVTPRVGVGDGALIGEVLTDTGGPETDYVDVSNDNFRLIDGAPGVGTGLRAFTDIGAYGREQPSSSGGLLTHPGMEGGMSG